MTAIKFNVTPMTGKRITIKGQRYELIGSRPHQRQDGKLSVVLTWQSHCPDCEEVFITTSGLSVGYLNRRCPHHHNAGTPVTRRNDKRMGGRHG